jgi:hypothetical protein
MSSESLAYGKYANDELVCGGHSVIFILCMLQELAVASFLEGNRCGRIIHVHHSRCIQVKRGMNILRIFQERIRAFRQGTSDDWMFP